MSANEANAKPAGSGNGNGNGKRHKLFIVLGALGALAAILIAVHVVKGWSRVSTDDAYVDGRVHSIASKVPGTVKRVLVDDNRPVKTGELLVEIDPQDYEVRVNEARAALDAEKSRLADAEAGIKAAQATVEVQEVAAKQAELDKNRASALFKDNVVPKERLEKSETAFNMSVSQLKAAKEQLARAASSKELEGSLIKQREAALETAKLNLSYTKLTAPTDGYVTKKSVEEGNQVAAGQPLMAVVALDDIWITANFKETQLKGVRPGQQAVIAVDTYPGVQFRGKVDSIMAGTGSVFSLFPPENALGNYVKVVQRIPVKIVLDKEGDSGHILRIGMSCIPTILTNE
jgi:membrane fusion protein, multidrug efflux system